MFNPPYNRKHGLALAAGALCVLAGALLVGTSKRTSLGYDEVIYAPAGLLYWKTGDLRINIEHPPLQKLTSSLPLLMMNVPLPSSDGSRTTNAWRFGYEVFFLNAAHPLKMIFMSRLPSILITLTLGIILFRLKLFQNKISGLIAAAVFLFDPLVLSNGSMAMNDIFITFFYFLTVLMLIRWIHGDPVSIYGGGLFCGLTIASKFSGTLLVPLFLIAMLMKSTKLSDVKRNGLGVLGALGIAAVAVLAVYRFDPSTVFEAMRHGLGFHQNSIITGFLLGPFPGDRAWLYYPVALLIKTPLPLLGLWGFSLVVLARDSASFKTNAFLLASCLVIFSASMMTKNHFGVRYLLPMVPILATLVGKAYQHLNRRSEKSVWMILMGWLVIEALAFHPHHMAYFNQLIGGPKNGHIWLDGSNQDWGQDIPSLASYLEKEGRPNLLLSYMGSSRPEAWGIEYQDVYSPSIASAYRQHDQANPIETNREFLVVSARLKVDPPSKPYFEFLETRKPLKLIGGTLFVYDVTNDHDAALWLAGLYERMERWALNHRQIERAKVIASGL